jgi:CRP-like cAMP-binding protein
MPGKSNNASAGPSRWPALCAQILTLAALALGMEFVLNTNGGTLFLFSSVGSGLVALSCAIVAVLAFVRFRRRHSLFQPSVFAPGEIVFSQGEAGDCMYFIQSGTVEVVRTEQGSESVVAVLSAGQYFGETALLTSQPRNATVRAQTAARLAALGKQNFLAMLKLMPSTREDVLKTVQERAMRAR